MTKTEQIREFEKLWEDSFDRDGNKNPLAFNELLKFHLQKLEEQRQEIVYDIESLPFSYADKGGCYVDRDTVLSIIKKCTHY